jgi:penicillin V acylase-like amidase (Ntn superfamily)
MCTSFAVYSQNNPIYGMNFDSDDIDLKLNIYNYADSDVFYFSGLMDKIYRDIAGINSNGLFICTQALEHSPNFQPCSNGNNVFVFDVIEESLRVGGKVSDFLDILNNRNAFFSTNPLFPNMGLHTIIADKYGDAVILEEGIHTNVISKIDGKFIAMTNFPNGNFENKKFDEVYGERI